MGDRFEVAVLDNLLLNPHLKLASKRAFLLVNRFFHATTDAHLRHPELHVHHFDCTIVNARFVLRVLMPRVPGLLVCARGEQFFPKMDLDRIKRLHHVRVNTTTCCMGTTAAFFLGHALANQDCVVRLTMGRRKCLTALRERGRIHLDKFERASEVDCRLVAGALLANAEMRIADYSGRDLLMEALFIDGGDILYLFVQLLRAFRKHGAPSGSVTLSQNPLGSAGIKALLLALVDPSGSPSVRMNCLDLVRYTTLGDKGMGHLTRAMISGDLVLSELYLANVGMRDDDMELLMAALRPSGNAKGRVRGINVLDVDGNLFGDSGMRALMVPYSLPCLRDLHVRNLTSVSKRCFVDLGVRIRDGLFPAIRCVSADMYNSRWGILDTAVRWWDLQRKMKENTLAWNAFVQQFKKEEKTAQKRDRVQRRQAGAACGVVLVDDV